MIKSNKYITKEYKTLLNNAIVVLSIVFFAIIGINIVLAIIASDWIIRLCILTSLTMSVSSVWLLCSAIVIE